MAGTHPSPGAPAPGPLQHPPTAGVPYPRPQRPRSSAAGFWVLLTLVVVAIGAIGTFVYLDRRDEQAAATTVPPTPAPPPPSALVTVAPSAIVAFPDMPVGQPLPALPVLDASSQQTFVFGYRRYDTAAPDSPYIEHLVQYGVATDTWSSITNGTVQPMITAATFRPSGRSIWYPDGSWERMPRSPASLSPEPDMWMAKRLSADDVVPELARPFTTIVDIEPGVIAGAAVRTITVQIDVAGFAAAHPDVHADWVFRWASPSPFDPALVDPSGRQVGAEPTPRTDPPVDTSGLPPDAMADVPTVLITLTADGGVETATVINQVDEFRSVYNYLGEINGPPPDDTVSEREAAIVWVDAPA